MKYLLMLLMIMPSISPTAETEGISLIKTYEENLTGNHQKEKIELLGRLFSPEGLYYKDIWAEIHSGKGESWRIDYGGGYEPEMQFIDLTHDGEKDIFYQSPTGGSGGLYTSRLDSLANGKLKEIKLPDQPYVKGDFKSNFQAKISISPKEKPVIVDVRSRMKDYVRLGIYNEEGMLLKPTPLLIDPIAFYEPVLLSDQKGYGLKSYQQISGAYHADQLGTIETLWYYDIDKWIVLQTNWVETGKTKE